MISLALALLALSVPVAMAAKGPIVYFIVVK